MIARAAPLKLLAAALAAAALAASAHAGQTVVLRHDIEAAGPALTLADVFVDAGAAGGRAVAPAPRPGETTNLSARFLAAAAAAAGLSWTPPDGLDQIAVTRRAAAAAPAARQYAELSTQAAARFDADPAPDALVHRGDLITLVYVAPGLQLTTRGKAMSDARQGESVRIVNLQSNRVVDAIVTGPGAASAGPSGGSF